MLILLIMPSKHLQHRSGMTTAAVMKMIVLRTSGPWGTIDGGDGDGDKEDATM